MKNSTIREIERSAPVPHSKKVWLGIAGLILFWLISRHDKWDKNGKINDRESTVYRG